jgi:hypothetical protein
MATQEIRLLYTSNTLPGRTHNRWVQCAECKGRTRMHHQFELCVQGKGFAPVRAWFTALRTVRVQVTTCALYTVHDLTWLAPA